MVREILLESNVVPIFAVTSNEKAIYEVKVNLCAPRKTETHACNPSLRGGGVVLPYMGYILVATSKGTFIGRFGQK